MIYDKEKGIGGNDEVKPMRKKIIRARRRRVGGFTLMEAVFSIMIVGLGVVAMMQLFGSGTKVNAYGNHLSSAVFLAEELQAMTDDVAFDDLLSYDGQTFNGVDANGNPVDLEWIQYVELWQSGTDGWTAEIDAISDVSAVPLPGAFWLLGSGLLALLGLGRKRQ